MYTALTKFTLKQTYLVSFLGLLKYVHLHVSFLILFGVFSVFFGPFQSFSVFIATDNLNIFTIGRFWDLVNGHFTNDYVISLMQYLYFKIAFPP